MLKDYVVFDLETTGFSKETCEIIEIGGIKVENNVVVEGFNELVKPKMYIPRQIQKITGITSEDVKYCDNIENVLARFYNFIGDKPILGYNLPFDYGFLEINGINTDIDFTYKNTIKGIDVLALTRKYLNLSSYKLTDVTNSLGIKPIIDGLQPHRAYYDAYVTYVVYVTLLNTFGIQEDIVTPIPLCLKDNNKYGRVVNLDALSLDC